MTGSTGPAVLTAIGQLRGGPGRCSARTLRPRTHPLRDAAGMGARAREITCRMGVIDAVERRLVPDPAGRLRELASDPGLLGL